MHGSARGVRPGTPSEHRRNRLTPLNQRRGQKRGQAPSPERIGRGTISHAEGCACAKCKAPFQLSVQFGPEASVQFPVITSNNNNSSNPNNQSSQTKRKLESRRNDASMHQQSPLVTRGGREKNKPSYGQEIEL